VGTCVVPSRAGRQHVNTGIENIRRVVRRSIPIVLAAVAVGVFATILVAQLRGVEYAARASVYVPATDLAASVSDVAQPYVDPNLRQDAELVVARAPALYERAARGRSQLGSAEELERAVEASPEKGGVIVFDATSAEAQLAVARANAVADEFVRFRADLRASTIEQALAETREKIEAGGSTPELRLLLSRLEVLKTLNTSGATVISRAQNATKTNPRPVRDALIGLGIGMVVGLLIAGTFVVFDTRVQSEDDVEDVLGVPVVSTLALSPHGSSIVTVGKHAARYADSYGLLAAYVSQIDNGKKTPTTVAVTSSIESEGKTTMSANLAVSLASRGLNVAVVDLDGRRGDLGPILGVPRDVDGFAELVGGSASLADVCWSVDLDASASNGGIHAKPLRVEALAGPSRAGSRSVARRSSRGSSESGSLMVVPAGKTLRQAPIGAADVRSLRTKLGPALDVLVLDMPPALATPDMTEISRASDVVLVVARHGYVTQRSLRQLARQSKNWGSAPVRAVLTGVPTREYAPYGRW
jgi:Mrp family chromosome partitioning ATPase